MADKKFTIPAGGSYPLNGNGETYLFCKFADRDVTVDIAGNQIVMRAGSYQEFAPLVGQNARVTFYNEDPDNPAAVIFVMGQGTYDEKIVKGEISVVPILRNANGTTKPDTRQPLDMVIAPEKLAVQAYSANDTVLVGDTLTQIPGTEIQPSGSADCIFAGPGGFPVFAWYYNGFNSGAWTQLDWDLNVIQSNGQQNLVGATPISNNSIMADVGWSPEHGFIGIDQTTLFALGATNQRTALVNPGLGNLATVAYRPQSSSLILEANTGDYVELENKTLAVKRQGNTGNTSPASHKMRVDWLSGRVYVIQSGSYAVEMDYDTMTRGTTFRTSISNLDGFSGYVVKGDIAASQQYVSWGYEPPLLVALRDYVTKPTFTAVRPGCEMVAAMTVPQGLPQITASVTVEELADAVAISGEVIKAAIEYYFRRKAPADYMDHIYFADLGKNRVGEPIKPISSGNETFKRAGIADNFEIRVPGRLSFTIDSELELGADL